MKFTNKNLIEDLRAANRVILGEFSDTNLLSQAICQAIKQLDCEYEYGQEILVYCNGWDSAVFVSMCGSAVWGHKNGTARIYPKHKPTPTTIPLELEAMKNLLAWAETQLCEHEETHRGGVIWEICDQCGMKWADDEGGKPEYKEPQAITNAREAIAKAAEKGNA